MKLTKEHRNSFVCDLNEVIEKIDLQRRIMEKDDKEPEQLCWHETELFLLEKKKELIESALISNEIDF